MLPINGQMQVFSRFRFCVSFVLGQLLSGHFPSYFQLLFFLKVHNNFLYFIVFGLFILLSALPHRFPNLFEPSDDIFSDLQLQSVNIFIVNIFDGVSDELFVDTFAQHGAGLQDETHFLFGQKLAGGIVFIQKELARKVNFIILI